MNNSNLICGCLVYIEKKAINTLQEINQKISFNENTIRKHIDIENLKIIRNLLKQCISENNYLLVKFQYHDTSSIELTDCMKVDEYKNVNQVYVTYIVKYDDEIKINLKVDEMYYLEPNVFFYLKKKKLVLMFNIDTRVNFRKSDIDNIINHLIDKNSLLYFMFIHTNKSFSSLMCFLDKPLKYFWMKSITYKNIGNFLSYFDLNIQVDYLITFSKYNYFWLPALINQLEFEYICYYIESLQKYIPDIWSQYIYNKNIRVNIPNILKSVKPNISNLQTSVLINNYHNDYHKYKNKYLRCKKFKISKLKPSLNHNIELNYEYQKTKYNSKDKYTGYNIEQEYLDYLSYKI